MGEVKLIVHTMLSSLASPRDDASGTGTRGKNPCAAVVYVALDTSEGQESFFQGQFLSPSVQLPPHIALFIYCCFLLLNVLNSLWSDSFIYMFVLALPLYNHVSP